MPPYPPGNPPQLVYSESSYNQYQMSCWKALDTVYHAHYFGYSETRQPTPGNKIDQTKYTAWKGRFEAAWATEATRDLGTRGLKAEELGENVMGHLYERFLQAKTQGGSEWT